MRSRLPALIVSQPLLWGTLILAGLWYARDRGVDTRVALVLLPAFLLEVLLYFACASQRLRERLAQLPPSRLAAAITLSAAPSYLVYTIPLGVFRTQDALAITAMAAVASFWYVLLKKNAWTDAAFLVTMALPVLFKVFESLYPNPVDRIPESALGAVMWYRTGLLALLVLRTVDGVGFGLLPRRSEWLIGAINFVLFLPVGIALAVTLDFVKPALPEPTLRTLLTTVLYFAGTLWFLAVAEEFFFRGLLQQMLTRLLGSELFGLLAASVAFGLAHLWFRPFPNWRLALLAAVAGVFYGRAFQQARSIRAAMVSHALVVTAWRLFRM